MRSIGMREAIDEGLSIFRPLDDADDLMWRRLAYAQKHGPLPRCRFCGRELARRTSSVCTRRACKAKRGTEQTKELRRTLGETFLAQRRARYDRHRALCVDCGSTRESGSRAKRCRSCLREHRRRLSAVRQRRARQRRFLEAA